MTQPEISRRCSWCGASIREQAFFCPQCGKQLKQQAAREKPPAAELDDTVAINRNLDDTIPITRTTADEAEYAKKKSSTPHLPSSRGKEAGARALEGVEAQIQRVTSRARDVKGDVLHRSQKLREISSVVIDEAGYDPSLRFVLVAAALFLLFIVIVILNKLIG